MQRFLRYAAIATPIAVLAFLILTSFFTSWSGAVVSQRPTQVEDPRTFRVLIVSDARDEMEVDWEADLVRSLELPVNAFGVPPAIIPEDVATTRKMGFSFAWTLTQGEDVRVFSTVTGRSVGVPLVLWVFGLFIYNYATQPRKPGERSPSRGASQSGQPPARRPQKGPPPGKRRRGQGRRR